VIVIDASAMIEFLLQTPLGSRVEARLVRGEPGLHAPHLMDVEVAQGLRRLVRARQVAADRAAEALADLSVFDLRRYSHVDLLLRVCALRDNFTAYDAVYVALAEAIDAPLITCDGPLGATRGHAARIEVIR
jgi:predicted nucleic acid-binding protein